MKLFPFLAIPLFLSFQEANALTVVESTDFSGGVYFEATPVGTLDVGSNTFSGSLAGTCVVADCNFGGPSDGDTQDSFNVLLAAGTQIAAITVSTFNVTGPLGFSASFEASKSPVAFPSLVSVTELPLNDVTSNLVVTPLGNGEYSLSVYGQGAVEPGDFSLGYTISVSVEAVPEPESYAMLASGLGIVGYAARRRKHKAA